MWNPLHFAVFHQRLELVKFIVSEMKVGIKITAPKALAEKEKDETNQPHLPEDKILILHLAAETQNQDMLRYLLDEL